MALYCCLCETEFGPNESGEYDLVIIQAAPCKPPYVRHHLVGVL